MSFLLQLQSSDKLDASALDKLQTPNPASEVPPPLVVAPLQTTKKKQQSMAGKVSLRGNRDQNNKDEDTVHMEPLKLHQVGISIGEDDETLGHEGHKSHQDRFGAP